MSRRHPTAGFGAGFAGRNALVHVADTPAIVSALRADFAAFPASMLVMRRPDQHEMRGCPAHFRAGHHQPEMIWLDVLAAHLEAMVHCHAGAGSITGQARFDAANHVF
jgi:hypothetical protein